MSGDTSCYHLPIVVDDIAVFDTAISAIWSDRLGGRITPAQAVQHEDTVRLARGRWLMRHGG